MRGMTKFDYLIDVGGCLCLDFTNTIDWRSSEHEHELLEQPPDLTRWARAVQLLPEPELQLIESTIGADPASAQRDLIRAHDFREGLYRYLAAVAAAARPPDSATDAINATTARVLPYIRVTDGDPVFEWQGAQGSVDKILWHVLASFARLLASPERLRLRECANPICRWLFVDRSRNGSRRWCSMAICGSRSKNQRYYWSHTQGA